MIALDDFAGTGWGVALQRLGIEEFGVELMPEAVATREKYGMRTIHRDIWDGLLGWEPTPRHDLYIASPPCQTFSVAGAGAGRAALDEVMAALHRGDWRDPTTLHTLATITDPRTALVLTPLARVYANRPRFVLFEQVPPVLPVWEACADAMRGFGYSVWTGYVHAEQYGVPQTRKRAVLIARNDGIPAAPPRPTHSAYYPKDPTWLDAGVPRWRSMADALGWGMVERPCPTVASGTEAGGGTDPAALGGSGARKIVLGEREAGRWIIGAGKAMGSGMVERYGTRRPRGVDEPAFTVRADAGGMEPGGMRWLVSNYSANGGRGIEKPGSKLQRSVRSADEPSTTLTSKAGSMTWHDGTEEMLRLSEWEAATLQSYPEGFTFEGTRGVRFRQIGNAVPPLMAEALIGAFL